MGKTAGEGLTLSHDVIILSLLKFLVPRVQKLDQGHKATKWHWHNVGLGRVTSNSLCLVLSPWCQRRKDEKQISIMWWGRGQKGSPQRFSNSLPLPQGEPNGGENRKIKCPSLWVKQTPGGIEPYHLLLRGLSNVTLPLSQFPCIFREMASKYPVRGQA